MKDAPDLLELLAGTCGTRQCFCTVGNELLLALQRLVTLWSGCLDSVSLVLVTLPHATNDRKAASDCCWLPAGTFRTPHEWRKDRKGARHDTSFLRVHGRHSYIFVIGTTTTITSTTTTIIIIPVSVCVTEGGVHCATFCYPDLPVHNETHLCLLNSRICFAHREDQNFVSVFRNGLIPQQMCWNLRGTLFRWTQCQLHPNCTDIVMHCIVVVVCKSSVLQQCLPSQGAFCGIIC